MDEAIITRVIIPHEPAEQELRIQLADELVLQFYLNDCLIFSGDWEGNFDNLFKLCLKRWQTAEETKI